MKAPNYIIVIGASAGGWQAVVELMAQMDKEVNASIFVVLHSPHQTFGDLMMKRLHKNSVFKCKMAEDRESIKTNTLYFAVPDQHLILKKGKIILGKGPVENRWRPSIDVLFRSAAVAYNARVIGIILTGLLQDGVSGMNSIKQCGGTCIVQDPREAEFPDMPQATLSSVEVDYCTSLSRIALILHEKTKNGVDIHHSIPESIRKEAEISERVAIGINQVESLNGERSVYSCPDCGGALWVFHDKGLSRFRCYNGHVYTGNDLLEKKRHELEDTLWVALRVLEERRNLLTSMSHEERDKGWIKSSDVKGKRAEELEKHINRLKDILFISTEDPELNREQLEKRDDE